MLIPRCKLFPAHNYFFKVNNRNTRKVCEICSKLTLKTRCMLMTSNVLLHLMHDELLGYLWLSFEVGITEVEQSPGWCLRCLELATLWGKSLWHVFSCEFYRVFQNNLFGEHLQMTNFIDFDQVSFSSSCTTAIPCQF